MNVKTYSLSEANKFVADCKASPAKVLITFKAKPHGYGKGKKVRECSVKSVGDWGFAMTYMRTRKVNKIAFDSLEEATFTVIR